MRSLLLACTALVVACAASAKDKPVVDEKFEMHAAVIHDQAITFDAQMDIPLDFMDAGHDVGKETTMQVDLPKMDRGQLDGAAFVIFASQGPRTPEGIAKARGDADKKLAAIVKMLATYPDRIELARRADDVKRITDARKHFAVISMVNAYAYGNDLAWLPQLYERGLRLVAFTHAGHNQYSDSDRPSERFGDKPEEHGGLSELGKRAIAEMNRLGIIVDVSQISPAAITQAIKLSKAPVIASHSGVKALVGNARNLSDAEMKAIANTGGVVHIVAFNSYLRAPSPEQQAVLRNIEESFGLKTFTEAASKLPADKMPHFLSAMADYRAKFPGAEVKDMADSIDYAVKLIGIDHVGVSTDMEHSGGIVGYKTAAEAGNLTLELVKRGYKEKDIGKIWSGNFLRVWKDVEKVAAKK